MGNERSSERKTEEIISVLADTDQFLRTALIRLIEANAKPITIRMFSDMLGVTEEGLLRLSDSDCSDSEEAGIGRIEIRGRGAANPQVAGMVEKIARSIAIEMARSMEEDDEEVIHDYDDDDED